MKGTLKEGVYPTDLVLTLTSFLRNAGVVGKFVEFCGEGVASLKIPDRATISNMCPEYGATAAFFPLDQQVLDFMRLTNKSEEAINRTLNYYKRNGMFVDYNQTDFSHILYEKVYEFDLEVVNPSVSGPKRPHDLINVADLKQDFD